MDKAHQSVLEAAAWTLPALPAAGLAVRSGRGRRATWTLVALTCAVIVLDKLVDVQIVAYRLGKAAVQAIDPESRWRGEHLWIRVVVLAALVAAGAAGLVGWARLDRERSLGKRLAVLGLALVVAFLGLRQLPPLKPWVEPPRDLLFEGTAWLLVVVGVGYGSIVRKRASVVATRGDGSPGSR